MVQRKTAAKYLNVMVEAKVLVVVKIGRENYYINRELMELFLNQGSAFTTARRGNRIGDR